MDSTVCWCPHYHSRDPFSLFHCGMLDIYVQDAWASLFADSTGETCFSLLMWPKEKQPKHISLIFEKMSFSFTLALKELLLNMAQPCSGLESSPFIWEREFSKKEHLILYLFPRFSFSSSSAFGRVYLGTHSSQLAFVVGLHSLNWHQDSGAEKSHNHKYISLQVSILTDKKT